MRSDDQIPEEFYSIEEKVIPFFQCYRSLCPYNLPYTATFNQAVFKPVKERIMGMFLAAGYRRNGNYLYNVQCENCRACVPIRLRPEELQLSRSQKRARAANKDIDIVLDKIKVDYDRNRVCNNFLSARFPNKNSTARAYYSEFFLNEITDTYEIQYLLQGKLVGVSIIDLGLDWMNAVYFYFDPDYEKRSLGTFNILTMADICVRRKISYLYLGYTIKEVAAMNYKEKFLPHQLLKDDEWVKVEKK